MPTVLLGCGPVGWWVIPPKSRTRLGGLVGIRAFARSDIGLRRELNEDCVWAGQRIWAVADGMGGHAAGEVASRHTIDALAKADQREVLKAGDVQAAILDANQRILQHVREDPDSAGMGTTIAGVADIVVGGAPHWAIFNVGDSRVYRCHAGLLSRATVDHSETEEMVLAGQITEAQARQHELRNVITCSLGTDPAPQVDLWVMPQTSGERFLICSDGVTSELLDEDIAAIVADSLEPREAVDGLISAALAAGGRDNISAVVLELESPGQVSGPEVTQPRSRVRDLG